MRRICLVFSFFFLTVFPHELAFAGNLLKAYVDKNTIYEGDVFNLTLEYPEETSLTPDLSPLKQNFRINTQSTQSKTTIINGQRTGKTLLLLELEPLSYQPPLIVPSITWGKISSEKISISVSSETKKVSSDFNFGLLSDKKEAYINEQVIIQVILSTTKNIRGGDLKEPEIEGALVEPLSDLEGKTEILDGVKTHIYQKKYAVFFTSEGLKTIPKISFSGQYLGKGSSRSFQGFFSDRRYKRVLIKTKDLTINIKARPKEAVNASSFLPSAGVTISDSVESKEVFVNVGEAFTRNFVVKAQGTLATSLPSIKSSPMENLNIYGETENKRNDINNEGITGILDFSETYIPTQEGVYHLPEKTIHWWDINTNQPKKAVFKGITIKTKDSVKSASGSSKPATPHVPSSVESSKDNQDISKEVKEEKVLWKIPVFILSTLLLLSWLIFFVYLFKSKKRKQISGVTDAVDESCQKLLISIKKKNAKLIYRQLVGLKISAEKHHRKDIEQLFSFKEVLFKLLASLEEHLYKNQALNQELLVTAQKRLLEILKDKNSPKIEDLYPE